MVESRLKANATGGALQYHAAKVLSALKTGGQRFFELYDTEARATGSMVFEDVTVGMDETPSKAGSGGGGAVEPTVVIYG